MQIEFNFDIDEIAYATFKQKYRSNEYSDAINKKIILIEKIKDSPNTIMGNTIKPLKGNLKNLWRYRVGDWRIIYPPDTEHNTIVILNLSHRKNAY